MVDKIVMGETTVTFASTEDIEDNLVNELVRYMIPNKGVKVITVKKLSSNVFTFKAYLKNDDDSPYTKADEKWFILKDMVKRCGNDALATLHLDFTDATRQFQGQVKLGNCKFVRGHVMHNALLIIFWVHDWSG